MADLSTVEAITRLAEQFGPFLFAVLFILVVTRTARGYYVECMTRKEPPPSDQEQKTYRAYFMSSVWIGVAVMSLSIGWWFYVQARGNHVYQITIVDLDPDESVLSNYYFKKGLRPTLSPDGVSMHDAHFLIVQDRPFKSGDVLAFHYFKHTATPATPGRGTIGKQIEIKYAGGYSLRYRVATDPSKGLRLESAALDAPSSTPVFTRDDIKAARVHTASFAGGFSGSKP
jgi:hypothetical protein